MVMQASCPPPMQVSYIPRPQLSKHELRTVLYCSSDLQGMKVSPWTTLPAELREHIYAYVLTESSGLTFCNHVGWIT
ncbi:hypothetical protein BDW02DRAFT_297775 [Decorospora gaudefroyi]|uniref:Uncharacterized protein n=1 Tax=Decorospora gaudefroyi TaxID=184978 RepID=A0A6A5JXL8_9PLEO|nr:hypothetical protein BDW02DRAFT_297775 [Decorospora gaudefroyi]